MVPVLVGGPAELALMRSVGLDVSCSSWACRANA